MSVVESQILNKVLSTNDYSLIRINCLTEDYFPSYKAEFNFISNFYNEYNALPDRMTFISRFPNFDLFDVAVEDKYLVDSIKEEFVFSEVANIMAESAEKLKKNAFEGIDFLTNKLNQVQLNSGVVCTNIVSDADTRFNAYHQKTLGNLNFYINSGFPELDKITNGWQCGEEFVVITARTGVGKTWFMMVTAERAWEQGYRVGFISPEMTADSVGYRFDTIRGHFSNSKLTFGKKLDGYADYIEDLKQYNNGFFVATPKDFQNRITVSKLKVFCEINKIDMLCIDGISYLTDERAVRTDNRTTELTHISEDLMALSNALKIPVLTVVQSGRAATVNKDEAPGLESIRDSDGIAYSATRVIALRQSGGSTMEITLRKNRYGFSDGKICYNWDAEHGNFIYLPVEDDAVSNLNTPTPQTNDSTNNNSFGNITVGTGNTFLSNDLSDVF